MSRKRLTKAAKDALVRNFVRLYTKEGPLKNFFVLGYGSLMYPHGVNGRGMLHHYKWKDLVLARLKGYDRGMYAGWKCVSFYGILPAKDPRHTINGTLIQIHTGRDLAAFLLSEGTASIQKKWFGKLMYELIDVTDKVSPYGEFKLPKGSKVYTLLCDKDNGAGRDPYPGYQERVWHGIQPWGKVFIEEFTNTGGVNPFTRENLRQRSLRNAAWRKRTTEEA